MTNSQKWQNKNYKKGKGKFTKAICLLFLPIDLSFIWNLALLPNFYINFKKIEDYILSVIYITPFTIWEIVASIAILTPASSIHGAGKHKNKEKPKEKRTKTTKNSWLPFDELIFAAFVGSIRETTTGLLAPGKKAPTNASTATNFTKN